MCVCVGPFWICVTLVFSVAISGNLSTFLSEMGNLTFHYRPQFHKGWWPPLSRCGCVSVARRLRLLPLLSVTIAAVVIFMYAWLVPVGLWGFLTWRQSAERQTGGYSFLETVCVYGYSLFIYIPTSVSRSVMLPSVYRFDQLLSLAAGPQLRKQEVKLHPSLTRASRNTQ